MELSEENTSRLARLVSAVPVQDVELEEDEVVMRMSLGFGSPAAVRGAPVPAKRDAGLRPTAD